MAWSQWIAFNKIDIGTAPTSIGVYGLKHAGEVTFYGKAPGPDGIRGRLLEHLSGSEGDCTWSSNHYSFRECDDPAQVLDRMIAIHVEEHGKPPRCNASDA